MWQNIQKQRSLKRPFKLFFWKKTQIIFKHGSKNELSSWPAVIENEGVYIFYEDI